MDFTEATAALEREFGAQYDTKDRKPDLTIAVVSGGTVDTVLDPAPALAFTRELAVKLWLQSARAVLDGEATLKSWAMSQPTIDTWNMTLADKKNTHRIAAKRYSASAVVTIILKSKAEIENEEAAEARKRDRATETYEHPGYRTAEEQPHDPAAVTYEHQSAGVDIKCESVAEAEALQQIAEKL